MDSSVPNAWLREFDSGMEFCSDYPKNPAADDWRTVRERFAEAMENSGSHPIIPKIIHQIWLGGGLPEENRRLMARLKKLNPGFEHKLWNESNIDFELETGNLLHELSNPGQKSDVLRYEILKRFGGIYADLDFYAIRSFDSLLFLNFFTGIVYHHEPSLANGLIGCIPNHPITAECLERVHFASEAPDFSRIMETTGPFMLTKVFMENFHEHQGAVALPNSYFYPYPNDSRYRTLGEDFQRYVKPETICVHLWHCSWMKDVKNRKSSWIDLLKNKLKFSKARWYWETMACGLEIDLAGLLRRAKAFPSFYRELQKFKRLTDWTIQVEPRLGDREEPAGSLGEYFWQDLFVARRILELSPERHIDVGSRIDGFVGHLACSRKVEVLDIRPLTEIIPGVTFHQIDITRLPDSWKSSADCLTCLHSIEHFGLGRYGDPIDPSGWISGLSNLALIVRPGGRLILSTPVGSERVKFNSHRIFHPSTIARHASDFGLRLDRFSYLSHGHTPGAPVIDSKNFPADFALLASQKYSLGIFEFSKSA